MLSGCVKNDAHLFNPARGHEERLAHIGAPFGKTLLPVTELHAGDIGAVAKLRDTLTGDTLTDKASPVAFPPVKLPEPSIAFAVEAKSRATKTAWETPCTSCLKRICRCASIAIRRTREFLVAGTGQQHVEIAVSRLKKRYGVEVP